MKKDITLRGNTIFFTAIWLPHDQLWEIIKRIASLTWWLLQRFVDFCQLSIVDNEFVSLSRAPTGFWTGNFLIRSQSLVKLFILCLRNRFGKLLRSFPPMKFGFSINKFSLVKKLCNFRQKWRYYYRGY